jgi:HEAT repeat protein
MVDASPVARAAQVAALGHGGRLSTAELTAARVATTDSAAAVRAAALGALVRGAPVRIAAPAWHAAAHDVDASVRRRAADLAPKLVGRRRTADPALTRTLVALLEDADVTVVEAAAWALGETVTAADPVSDAAVPGLARVVTDHRDALAREAAVAALGAIGDERGVEAILAACHDKPAVRRRAVLALAPFTGTAVDAAIAAALEDRDWQVRQAAEDLGSDETNGT